MAPHRLHSSKVKQRTFASSMASDFDAAAIHNLVHDEIGDDTELTQLCDAAARADLAADARRESVGDDHDHTEVCEEAWGKFAHVARERALEVVAEACATLVQEGDQWVDEGHWDEEAMADAKHEAREWLQLHSNEAERADVSMGAE